MLRINARRSFIYNVHSKRTGGAGGEGGGRKILDKLAGGSGCFLERGVFF